MASSVTSVPSPEVALRECAQFVDKTTLDDEEKPLVIHVPQKQLEDSERLQHVWNHLQRLLQDKQFSRQAKAALRNLQAKRAPTEISIQMLPVRDRLTDLQAVMPGMDRERAIAIQSELYQRYSSPEFQATLFNIYCCNNPRTLTYNKKLTKLLRSARADIFPRFGFSPGPEGEVALALALNEYSSDPEMQTLTAFIDEILYTTEAPMVAGSKNLTKKQILTLLRTQISAFRTEEFQRKLKYLKAATVKSPNDDCYTLEGRSRLAMTEQRRFFVKYGLEPNYRGLHSLINQFSQYIMDPEVATYSSAVNMLLGMEMSACERFNERLVEISAEDPCPTEVKPPTETPIWRRHSIADPIKIAELSGKNADPQAPASRRHSIHSVAAPTELSGRIADPEPPSRRHSIAGQIPAQGTPQMSAVRIPRLPAAERANPLITGARLNPASAVRGRRRSIADVQAQQLSSAVAPGAEARLPGRHGRRASI